MKKLLVFLHCKGSNASQNLDFAQQTALKLGCKLLTFDAPFAYSAKPDSFVWFNKDEKGLALPSDVNHSLDYIFSQITDSGYQMQDVILCGHSQGGAMAAIFAMQYNPYAVISICADLPANLSYRSNKSNSTVFYWIEAMLDTYLTPQRKNTYNILNRLGYNLRYLQAPHSTHFDYISDVNNILVKENLCSDY